LITTHPVSISDIESGSDTSFTVEAVGTNLSYRWRKDGIELDDGGNISGAFTSQLFLTNVSASDEGEYTCNVTGDCGIELSDPATLALAVSVDNISSNDVKIYPNPVKDRLKIESAGRIEFERIEIKDMTGRTVLFTELNADKDFVQVSELKSGVYLAVIYGKDDRIVKRFIKQ
jgi:hypothetical protein